MMHTELFDNRYRITELVGGGATAKVYRAFDTVSQKEIALKVFDETCLDSEDALRLFEREVRVVARLEAHPNLLNYYGGSLKEGCRYLAMDLADGETLMHYLNRSGGKLPLQKALSIYSQLLSVLSYIHKRGVIHRDIKPQNIRIAEDGTIKLYDFGIAIITDAEQEITGKAVGTVNYISPEQARGVEVYPCSDLYSASIVLYEMLTGILPFTSDKPLSEDRMIEIIRKHFKEAPIRVTHYDPNIPDAIEEIVMKGLNKNLSARFESADEVLRYLSLYYQNPSVHFGFDLPDEEFDYRAALPKNTSPEAFKPNIIAKTLSETTVNEKTDREMTRKKLLLITLFLVLTALATAVIYLALKSVLFYKIDQKTVITKNGLLYRPYTEELYDELVREGYSVTVDYQYSPYYDGGIVIAQEPLPLAIQELSRDGAPELHLTVCEKSAFTILENYIGEDYRKASLELSFLGYSVSVQKTPSSKPIGQVISTVPLAEEAAFLSDTITLTVSSGKSVAYAYMPNCIGDPISQAKSELKALGISFEVVYEDSELPYGTVFYQSRPYGEKLAREYTSVYLSVSNRIEEPDSTDSPEIPETPNET